MKHTPGPWLVVVYEHRAKKLIKGNKNCIYAIASVDGSPIQVPSKNEDNARLIAAAPEMLEALETVEKLTTDVMILAGVRSIIAKARGES